MKENINSVAVFMSIIKKRAEKIIKSNLFKYLAMTFIYIIFLAIFANISNLFQDFSDEQTKTISILNISINIPMANFIKNTIIFLLCIIFTSPIIAGIYSFIYNSFTEKEVHFLDILNWYCSLEKFYKAYNIK